MNIELVLSVLIPVLAYVIGYRVGMIRTFKEGYKQGVMDLANELKMHFKDEEEEGQ